MDVVIVGGGIVGLASAYYLRQRGAAVVVCEKSSIGAGNTERSAGGIRAQFSTAVNVELSLASMDVWDRFEEDFGTGIERRRNGYLFLARDEKTAAGFRENVAMQNDRGVPSEYLTPEEATRHCPGLVPEQFAGATYSPEDGFSDPHLGLQGYATAAREAGAEIRTGTPVTDIRRRNDAVVGVDTPDGTIDADFVVNAAGAWAGRVCEMAGFEYPITPVRRQIAVTDPGTPVPETVPLTIDLDTGSYFRPEREGTSIVGGYFGERDDEADPDRFDEGIDMDWAVDAVERAAGYTTYFGPETRIRRGWAGLYAKTPDHHAIYEEREGLVTATGFSGHGYQHAPASGQIVADLVFDGEASVVDVSMLDGRRFERGDELVERNVA